MNNRVLLLKKWYYNLPIKVKLNLSNLLIIVVPMVLLAILANKVSSDIIIEKSVNNSVQGLTVVSRSIDSLLNQAEYLSKLTVNNYNVQQILPVTPEDLVRQPEKRLEVVSSLDNIVGDQDIISSALVFTKRGIVLSSSKVGTYKLSVGDSELNNILKAAEIGKGQVLWRNTQPVSYYSVKDQVNCLSLFRALIDRNTGETMGAIEIDIDQKRVAQLFGNLDSTNSGETFIIDGNGTVVCSSAEDRLYGKVTGENYYSWIMNSSEGGKVFTIGRNEFLVTSVKYGRLGLYIIGIIPLENLTRDNQRVTSLIFFVGLLCISLAAFTSFMNSRAITKPIISLSRDMSNAGEGDLEVRSAISANDEVGNLAKSFNTMIGRISDLMDKVYSEQKKKREYELLALQSQINPHFLYNTLESVCSLANKQRNDDVVSMVKALAMFYRSVLSKGRNIITIKEDLDNIRHYLQIQKIRYGDKFDYWIEVDENILDKPIVKLSLQPLVENSIYHGIRQKQGQGRIWILGNEEEKRIKITVVDDGLGFDESISGQIFLAADEPQQRKSYGLKNVDDRIKLYFGPEYGIYIASQTGKGTRVTVVLPAVCYEA